MALLTCVFNREIVQHVYIMVFDEKGGHTVHIVLCCCPKHASPQGHQKNECVLESYIYIDVYLKSSMIIVWGNSAVSIKTI